MCSCACCQFEFLLNLVFWLLMLMMAGVQLEDGLHLVRIP